MAREGRSVRVTITRRVIAALVVAVTFGLAFVGAAAARNMSASASVGRPTGGSDTANPAGAELTTPKAVVLGVVEGLTEYLPVSSTGHLTVAERIMDVGQRKATSDAVKSYTVIIQIGAIAAVVWLYWGRLIQLLHGLTGRDADGRRILIALLVAFAPAAVVGKALEGTIENRLLGSFPVAVAWLAGGVAILALGRRWQAATDRGTPLTSLTTRQALVIGLAQVLALWPGTSRSLVTIVGGLLVGLSLPAAVEFSFLLGLATLTAATGYEVVRHGSQVTDAFGVVAPAIGIVVAFVTAVAAVKWLVAYLNHHDLALFGWYRVAIGAATLGLLATGRL